MTTVSLAALLPCCESDGAKKDAETAPVASATTSSRPSASSSAASASRASASALPPYGFEMAPTVLNPKKGGKAVIFGGPDDCFTFGPENGQMSGIQFARQKTTCPEGIATTLAQCRGGILDRRGDRCSCMSPEGNPPPPPRTVDCPSE